MGRKGYFEYDKYHKVHSSSDNGQSGVALITDKDFSKTFITYGFRKELATRDGICAPCEQYEKK